MGTHDIDPDGLPYAPDKLAPKQQVDPAAFFGVDLRVGIVMAVEAFPEARKPAWKLTVDFGPRIGSLQTSAQITNYGPQDLVGRHVVGVVNLPDKRIAGFTSQFLVLGGLQADGTVRLLGTDVDLPPGSAVL
jgi:tRNA-binding protein